MVSHYRPLKNIKYNSIYVIIMDVRTPLDAIAYIVDDKKTINKNLESNYNYIMRIIRTKKG